MTFGGGEGTYQVARAAGLAAALLLGVALERARPHTSLQPAWATNLGLWAAGAALVGAVCGTCGWLVAAWGAERGLGLLAWADVRGPAAVAAGAVGLDAVSYAWHLANHRVGALWRFHQVHHGDASFHVTTALRFHPGELLLALPVRLAAVLALGIPPTGVLVFELVFGFANVLEHGNFDLPRRLEHSLQRVLVTPALHRGHHACDWRELDTNFGTILSVWDRLAGTLRPSEPDRAVVTGLPSRRVPPALAESLLLPFRASARPDAGAPSSR